MSQSAGASPRNCVTQTLFNRAWSAVVTSNGVPIHCAPSRTLWLGPGAEVKTVARPATAARTASSLVETPARSQPAPSRASSTRTISVWPPNGIRPLWLTPA